MIAAVVPAQNEEYRLSRVLEHLLAIDLIDKIFVILNGSNQLTKSEAETYYKLHKQNISLVSFREPLGIDVPRAVGANLAFSAGADYVLFIDGDMVGEYEAEVTALLKQTKERQLDLALCDCYPHNPPLEQYKEALFYYRFLVNKKLGLATQIKIATPSHGPHVISRRMLNIVPWEDYAVPPTLLVHATWHKLKIDLAGSIPHLQLGSSIKDQTHNNLIIETIIGDCLEAICMIHNLPRQRYHEAKMYIGYHSQRRFDLLREFIAGRSM
ncbi:MAG: glycosyltransferase family 2 protein [Firmicutes bacterium]|nr:glycosyltransferase family 2 protein [Bacillota bacterium]